MRLGEGTGAHAERARAQRGMDRVGTEVIKFDLILTKRVHGGAGGSSHGQLTRGREHPGLGRSGHDWRQINEDGGRHGGERLKEVGVFEADVLPWVLVSGRRRWKARFVCVFCVVAYRDKEGSISTQLDRPPAGYPCCIIAYGISP